MDKVGKNILLAAGFLKEGRLVAVPTETVYGLAANAFDKSAVAAIFEAKNRPQFDPLIIHTYSVDKAADYVLDFPFKLLQLAKAYWPGPLTLLLDKKEVIPDLVTSGLPKVAIRVPNHLLTLELLRNLPFPLAAPSANPFGYISPTKPEHVSSQLGNKVAYILDGGTCEVGIESTIVGMEGDTICIYRLGGLSTEDIEKIAGKVTIKLNLSGNPVAPGQMKSHYAPLKKLIIGEVERNLLLYKNVAVLSYGKKEYPGANTEYNLSPKANLKEAAANLFTALRQLDDSDADVILCDLLPDMGLGRAINDRLKRAEHKKE